jgi:hypothetical protein
MDGHPVLFITNLRWVVVGSSEERLSNSGSVCIEITRCQVRAAKLIGWPEPGWQTFFELVSG